MTYCKQETREGGLYCFRLETSTVPEEAYAEK